MEVEHIRAIIIEQFLSERETFDKKFSEQTSHPDDFWNTILTRETGKIADAVYEETPSVLYNGLVRCGAVCMAWAEAIQKRNIKRRVEKGDDLI